MRKLDRATCPAPACLGTYTHGAHTWGDVSSDHKREIRAQLIAMQGHCCAYCEGDVVSLGQHIEHFRRKSLHPALSFDWKNLFSSCDQRSSCGHFKDRGAEAYDISDLINPCDEDPDTFFIFRADGTISIRKGLSLLDQRRAAETLRVFSLDAKWGRLRAMRKAAVSGYLDDADAAFNEGWSLDEIRAFFQMELEIAQDLPFCTAIRHVLTERE
ncbi:retron system putative HNH endonuclease [Methylobacterium sp. Leaf94]|uniref:retron system putative HNH endonuclease n=1 Tax=Methylobacterium sp. Leaf94 TaxID=1736250 RepID=UPI0009E9432B|nr:retron system putative HNH endonuclease [Methylobacterium sp. Leaf94]